jgi:hypothetical protein
MRAQTVLVNTLDPTGVPLDPKVLPNEASADTSIVSPDDHTKSSEIIVSSDVSVADAFPPDVISSAPQVDVFDGRSVRRVALSDLLLLQEDSLLAFLVDCGGDVVRALNAVETDARNRLVSQWNAKEVALYMEGVKLHKTDAPLIYRSSGLARTRSVKSVIDFHYRFYFLNSTQMQHRELAMGRAELLNAFRCADLLMEADSKYVLATQADMDALLGDMQREGLFAALDAFSAEIDAFAARKPSGIPFNVVAVAPPSTAVSGQSQGKRGRQPALSSGSSVMTSAVGGAKKSSGPQMARASGCGLGVVAVDISTCQAVRIYPSAQYAAQVMRCSPADVTSCLLGRSEQCGGFRWRAYDGPRIDCEIPTYPLNIDNLTTLFLS